MPIARQIMEIKGFLLTARRKDAKYVGEDVTKGEEPSISQINCLDENNEIENGQQPAPAESFFESIKQSEELPCVGAETSEKQQDCIVNGLEASGYCPSSFDNDDESPKDSGVYTSYSPDGSFLDSEINADEGIDLSSSLSNDAFQFSNENLVQNSILEMFVYSAWATTSQPSLNDLTEGSDAQPFFDGPKEELQKTIKAKESEESVQV